MDQFGQVLKIATSSVKKKQRNVETPIFAFLFLLNQKMFLLLSMTNFGISDLYQRCISFQTL